MDGQITICQQWIALWSDSLKVIPKLETHTLWENKSDKERNRACDYVNFYCSYKKKVSIIWEAWFFMLYVDRLPIMQVHIKREESFFFFLFLNSQFWGNGSYHFRRLGLDSIISKFIIWWMWRKSLWSDSHPTSQMVRSKLAIYYLTC